VRSVKIEANGGEQISTYVNVLESTQSCGAWMSKDVLYAFNNCRDLNLRVLVRAWFRMLIHPYFLI